MIDLIAWITVLVLGLVLSNIEFIGDREIKIITILGWLIYLFFAKGEIINILAGITGLGIALIFFNI